MLVAFVILAALLLIVAPILTAHREIASTIELSRGLLYRYRALSARHAQLAARLEAVERAATDAGAYLREASDSLAGAELQMHVQSIVERSGGELYSVQVLPVEPVGLEVAVRRVALKLKLMVEMTRLQDLIYNLETAQPFVFLSELRVLSVGESRDRGDAGAKPVLEVRLQAYGFTHVPSIIRGPTARQEVSPLARETNGLGAMLGPS